MDKIQKALFFNKAGIPFVIINSNNEIINTNGVEEESYNELILKNNIFIDTSKKLNNYNLYTLEVNYKNFNFSTVTESANDLLKIYRDYEKLPYYKNDKVFYYLLLSEYKYENNIIIDKPNYSIKIVDNIKINIEHEVKSIDDFYFDQFSDMIVSDTSNLKTSFEEKKEEGLEGKFIRIESTINSFKREIRNKEFCFNLASSIHHVFTATDKEFQALSIVEEFFKTCQGYEKNLLAKWWPLFDKKKTEDFDLFINNLEKQKDDVEKFTDFLNRNEMNKAKLKEAFKLFKIKDYDLDNLYMLIKQKLERTMGEMQLSTVKKLCKGLYKEIDEEQPNINSKAWDEMLGNYILDKKFNNKKHLLNIKNTFYLYDKGLWKIIEDNVITQIVFNTIIHEIMKVDSEENLKIREVLDDAKVSKNVTELSDKITRTLKYMTTSRSDNDDLNLNKSILKNYTVINCLNKEIYVYKDGKIEVSNHSFDSYLFTQINSIYNPEVDCPKFKKFLIDLFRNNPDCYDIIDHLLECISYFIFSENKTRAGFMLWQGSGSNAKSTLIKIIINVLGLNSVYTSRIDSFSKDSHASSSLLGKKIFVDDDMKKDIVLDDSVIKTFSESKIITANPKFRDSITFMCMVSFILLCNTFPKIMDTTNGFIRRALVFKFNSEFDSEKINEDLIHDILKEKSGILNLLLAAYSRVMKRRKFLEPVSCINARQDFLRKSNSQVAFMEDKLDISGNYNDWENADHIFKMYCIYCEENNNGHKKNKNNFLQDLTNNKKISIEFNTNTTFIRGAKLKYAR